jgi:plasmid stabilization system protein ParE
METSLSRLLRGFMATALLTLVTTACNRPAQPSEDFTDAHSRFSKLYAKSGNEAFLDPEMARIEAQLRLVPHDSLDAESARELIERIKKGRAQALKVRREFEQSTASASERPTTGSPSSRTRSPRCSAAGRSMA